MFARYFPKKGVQRQTKTIGSLFSREVLHYCPTPEFYQWTPGDFELYQAVSVQTPIDANRPFMIIHVRYTVERTAESRRIQCIPWKVKVIMDSETAGAYIKDDGETGTYSHGVMEMLLSFGRLPVVE